MATEYGKRLRQARKHAKLNQTAAAKKTGIPQSTISTAERLGNGSGETPVYAKAYGVSAHWLATGEGEMAAQEAHSPAPDIQPTQTLESHLRGLSGYLAQLSEKGRVSAKLELAAFVDDPDRYVEAAVSIQAQINLANDSRDTSRPPKSTSSAKAG